MNKNYLVTGGAGFIGSHLVKLLLMQPYDQVEKVVVVDCLDYAGNINNFAEIMDDERFQFFQVDINNKEVVAKLLHDNKIDCVFHLAAHSHVDRSLSQHKDFIVNNVMGTYNLLATIQDYYNKIDQLTKLNFKVIHVSTDEVYGDYGNKFAPAIETAVYAPTSPYAGSKAAADMLVHSFVQSFKLPILKLHLSNNFGPNQYPEKLIPVTILSAIQGKEVRIYGNGQQRRQWIYVKDTVKLLYTLSQKWDKNHSYVYNISGQEITNLALVEMILHKLDQFYPVNQNPAFKNKQITSYCQLIDFVADRSCHDQRYWTKDTLLQTTNIPLPKHDLDLNLNTTIKWYLQHHKTYQHKVTQFHYGQDGGDQDNRHKATKKMPTKKSK